MTIQVSALVAEPEPGDFGRDGQIDFDDFFLFVDIFDRVRLPR